MENKNQHIMYGFIAGIAMVVVNLVLYLTGLSFKSGFQYVSAIPFLIGIILNAIAFSKSRDGFVTFGNVFGNCFKASMIVTLVMIVWSVISMFIFPEMKDKALNMASEQMHSNPKMTEDQIDMALNITKKYWNTFLIAGAIFGTLIYGVIFSLIGAIVAQKKGTPPITSDNF